MREALLNLSHITTDLKQSVFHQTSRTLFNLSFQLHCWTDNEWDSRELRAVLDRFKHRRVCYLTFFHFFVNLLELELIPLCLNWCAVLVHCGAVCSDELILHIWLLKLPMNPGERIGLKIGSGDCRPSGRSQRGLEFAWKIEHDGVKSYDCPSPPFLEYLIAADLSVEVG